MKMWPTRRKPSLTVNPLVDYFRCPESVVPLVGGAQTQKERGFFKFGEQLVCWGACGVGTVSKRADERLSDAREGVTFRAGRCVLPFDPNETVENLRRERYCGGASRDLPRGVVREAYYRLRFLMTPAVRASLYPLFLHGWRRLVFPAWPVDSTVDRLHRELLRLCLLATGQAEIPFIWFWPAGSVACVVMTHDVEEKGGLDFCGRLMEIDAAHNVRSSFQIIPRGRYAIPAGLVKQIQEAGLEINVHDLNHDGFLYRDRDEFLRRAEEINRLARELGAVGFRAGLLYRDQDWYDALDLEYDMSVPNVGHLEAQRGGCCTVMPYFVGRLVELPVTTTQDYALFNVLRSHSIDHWVRQTEMIVAEHGLVSYIVHPDYIRHRRELETYESLLRYLSELQRSRDLWLALPKEVNAWWRIRKALTLRQNGDSWSIEGSGKEQACIAYARIDGDSIVYRIGKPESLPPD